MFDIVFVYCLCVGCCYICVWYECDMTVWLFDLICWFVVVGWWRLAITLRVVLDLVVAYLLHVCFAWFWRLCWALFAYRVIVGGVVIWWFTFLIVLIGMFDSLIVGLICYLFTCLRICLVWFCCYHGCLDCICLCLVRLIFVRLCWVFVIIVLCLFVIVVCGLFVVLLVLCLFGYGFRLLLIVLWHKFWWFTFCIWFDLLIGLCFIA